MEKYTPPEERAPKPTSDEEKLAAALAAAPRVHKPAERVVPDGADENRHPQRDDEALRAYNQSRQKPHPFKDVT